MNINIETTSVNIEVKHKYKDLTWELGFTATQDRKQDAVMRITIKKGEEELLSGAYTQGKLVKEAVYSLGLEDFEIAAIGESIHRIATTF